MSASSHWAFEASRQDARNLRRTRDALLQEMAAAAEALSRPSGDAVSEERERWIADAASYAEYRQAAVDQLSEIDARLGGEAPEPVCRVALERILAADRMLLAEAARLMDQIQSELEDRRTEFRAVRSYVAPHGDPAPSMTRTG